MTFWAKAIHCSAWGESGNVQQLSRISISSLVSIGCAWPVCPYLLRMGLIKLCSSHRGHKAQSVLANYFGLKNKENVVYKHWTPLLLTDWGPVLSLYFWNNSVKDPEVKLCGIFFFFQLVKDRGEPLHGGIHIYFFIFFVFGLGICTRYNLVQISWEFM